MQYIATCTVVYFPRIQLCCGHWLCGDLTLLCACTGFRQKQTTHCSVEMVKCFVCTRQYICSIVCPNLAIRHKTVQILAEFKQCLCKLRASKFIDTQAFILHLYLYCKLRMVPGYPAENFSKSVPHILTYYPSAGSLVIILFSSHKLSHAKK